MKKCTKNSECDIFDLKSKNKKQENIINNANETANEEIEKTVNLDDNSEKLDAERVDEIQAEDAVLQKQANTDENFWLLGAFAIGIVMWIVVVISSFML